MRGRRRTAAATLAEVLSQMPGADAPALVAAFADACGPRLAREATARGVLRDGRLLVLVRTEDWAAQVRALEAELCARVNSRLGRAVANGLEIRVAAER
jgi:predicted nucleic acid-binding Zn ribbon protein